MISIFQISSEVNSGSVGRIAEQIGEQVLEQGWESYIAYARANQPSCSNVIKIGTNFDLIKHGILTRFTDRHGFGSKGATRELINAIKRIKPDIIQLQHLHGYFINIEILFDFLSKSDIPVVWTFHDCWSFTGHCAYYEFIGCDKWQTGCNSCPQKHEYPKSLFLDSSAKNFEDKKRLFNSVKNLTIVPVSNWLGRETKASFLKYQKINVIQNGIDLSKFNIKEIDDIKIKHNIENKFLILGVASPWNNRKGLRYFVELSNRLDSSHQIVLVGLSKEQIKDLPYSIIGIERTENIEELAKLYSAADVFVNPTLEDTFPTTNLEAMACGTPIVTFRSGGSPEAIDSNTGIVVDKDDVDGLEQAIYVIKQKSKDYYRKVCRERAEMFFDKTQCFSKYIELYKTILNKENGK